MNFFSWALRIIAGSFLMVWLPMASFAFTPGAFVVSPAEIDLGTVRVLPGSSAGPYAFSISVVGGPVPDSDEVADPDSGDVVTSDSDEEATFFASSDAPWLTLDPTEGTAPGSITATATVSETMSSGVWTANVTIVSGLDPNTEPAIIPVTINVIRSIGDLLTVSPTKLDIQMTDQNVSQQTFPITIANADPNKPTDFQWSARSDVGWLVLSADEGWGNTTVSLRVDPEAIYLNNDTDANGIPDAAVGIVTFRSSLNTEAITLTVNATILPSTEPSVSPSQLYWTVEKSSADAALTFSTQRLQVFGFESGWTAASDAGFVSVHLYDASGLSSPPCWGMWPSQMPTVGWTLPRRQSFFPPWITVPTSAISRFLAWMESLNFGSPSRSTFENPGTRCICPRTPTVRWKRLNQVLSMSTFRFPRSLYTIRLPRPAKRPGEHGWIRTILRAAWMSTAV